MEKLVPTVFSLGSSGTNENPSAGCSLTVTRLGDYSLWKERTDSLTFKCPLMSSAWLSYFQMPFTTFRLIKCNVSISKDFIQLKIDKLEHKISLNNFKIDNLWLDITRHAKRGSGEKEKGWKEGEKDVENVTMVWILLSECSCSKSVHKRKLIRKSFKVKVCCLGLG